MALDISELSKEDLKKLQKDVEKALKSYDERRKQEAKAAAEAAIKEFGFSLSDLTTDKVQKTKSTPKYRKPGEPDVTWTGKGRKPKWVVEHLDNGGKIEDLEINW